MSENFELFDGYGIVLEAKKVLPMLQAMFGPFEHINDVIDHKDFPKDFCIEQLNDSFLFGNIYSVMDPDLTRRRYEHKIQIALEKLFRGTPIKVECKSQEFLFERISGRIWEI